MSLYVIGDLHLSLSSNKPMDIFGGVWKNYVEKLREGLSVLTTDDTSVLAGDLSWGMNFSESLEDFRFIHEIPGRKIIIKGNHDYWWSTATKAYEFFKANGFDSIEILNNNCCFYKDYALCGTRGWSSEELGSSEHDVKMRSRELLRRETSLKAGGDREKIAFLHYPPKTQTYECTDFTNMLTSYGVKNCYYGHLHGKSIFTAYNGFHNYVDYRLISADYLNFKPLKILD